MKPTIAHSFVKLFLECFNDLLLVTFIRLLCVSHNIVTCSEVTHALTYCHDKHCI